MDALQCNNMYTADNVCALEAHATSSSRKQLAQVACSIAIVLVAVMNGKRGGVSCGLACLLALISALAHPLHESLVPAQTIGPFVKWL